MEYHDSNHLHHRHSLSQLNSQLKSFINIYRDGNLLQQKCCQTFENVANKLLREEQRILKNFNTFFENHLMAFNTNLTNYHSKMARNFSKKIKNKHNGCRHRQISCLGFHENFNARKILSIFVFTFYYLRAAVLGRVSQIFFFFLLRVVHIGFH